MVDEACGDACGDVLAVCDKAGLPKEGSGIDWSGFGKAVGVASCLQGPELHVGLGNIEGRPVVVAQHPCSPMGTGRLGDGAIVLKTKVPKGPRASVVPKPWRIGSGMGFGGTGVRYRHRKDVSYENFNEYRQNGKGMAECDGRRRGPTAVADGSASHKTTPSCL